MWCWYSKYSCTSLSEMSSYMITFEMISMGMIALASSQTLPPLLELWFRLCFESSYVSTGMSSGSNMTADGVIMSTPSKKPLVRVTMRQLSFKKRCMHSSSSCLASSSVSVWRLLSDLVVVWVVSCWPVFMSCCSMCS